jgi:hypothetical protein
MILSTEQIIQLAQTAGFTGTDLATAVAVALAESGGDPNAYNPETAAGAPQGKGSYGLWQIYLEAHPEDASLNLYDPQTNANAAYQTYANAGGAFTPWSTFKSGAYLAQLPAVGVAIAAASVAPDVDAITSDGSANPPDGSQMAMLIVGGVLVFGLIYRFFA